MRNALSRRWSEVSSSSNHSWTWFSSDTRENRATASSVTSLAAYRPSNRAKAATSHSW
jgi:hypothetical protein